MANKDERITVSLDELTLDLLTKEAIRADVSVGTKARHLIVQAIKENLLRRKISDSTLAEIVNGDRE